MAGATTKRVYLADDGTSYKVRMPNWEFTVSDHAAALAQIGAAATTQPELPRGVQRRKRFYRITGTGAEGAITVLSPASNLWTSIAGTPITIPLFNAALAGADNATLQGRTGEKMKAI